MTGFKLSAMNVLFAGLVATALTFMLALVPLGEVPDEMTHVLRADGLLNGHITGRRSTIIHEGAEVKSAGFKADPSLFQAGFEVDFNSRVYSKETLAKARAAVWGSPIYIHAPNTAVYGPAFYVPATLSFGVTKWLGGGPHDALVVARFINAMLYVILGTLALALATRGKVLLMIILGLPMSLSLAASINQDGLFIAACVLAAALFTRILDEKQEPWTYGAFCFLLLIIFMAKPPYLPLALFMLIPAWRAFQRRTDAPEAFGRQIRVSVFASLAVVMPALGWIIYNMIWVSVPFTKISYQSGPLSGVDQALFLTDPGWQIRILLSDITRLLTIPYDTIVDQGSLWWMQFIGVLGQNAYLFSQEFYTRWEWGLVGILLLALVPGGLRHRPAGSIIAEYVLYLLLLIGCLWLIMIAQYISWTQVGAVMVDGIQGRYFIPLAPFLVFLFPRKQPLLAMGTVAQAGSLVLILYGAVASANLLINSYYLH
jgi:uncharacterized membrane protein